MLLHRSYPIFCYKVNAYYSAKSAWLLLDSEHLFVLYFEQMSDILMLWRFSTG